jgi:hypothetical protein
MIRVNCDKEGTMGVEMSRVEVRERKSGREGGDKRRREDEMMGKMGR